MKTIAITLTFLFLSGVMMGQDEIPAPSPKKASFSFKGKDDRMILDFNWSNWIDGPKDIDLDFAKSRGFGLKLMKDSPIKESRFSVGFGLGFATQNLHTDALITTDSLDNTVFIKAQDLKFKTNKLSLNYLEVPLEIRFRSKQLKKDNKLKIAAGGVVGILLQSHTKYKDDDVKFKEFNIDNLEPLRYGVTVRLGYGEWALSGNYYLSSSFKSGDGPEFTTYTVGLSITPF